MLLDDKPSAGSLTTWSGVGTPTGEDNRRVVLLKSLATNNRFYTLVEPDSGLTNAGTIPAFEPNMVLGVAYPCLEDGLNDFAVIRTTFETLDFFPADDDMRGELFEIIDEARNKLMSRLVELRDRVANRTAHFLGTDLEEIRSYAMDMVRRGYPRRNLDSMMKLDVFAKVAEMEPVRNGPEPLYFYKFRNTDVLDHLTSRSARVFVAGMFDDILQSVADDRCYASRHVFDRDVFQKFIAMMFVNYATTDPIFYGTHKADYGVSGDKAMDDTPLYIAVGKQLREIEARLAASAAAEVEEVPTEAAEGLPGEIEIADVSINSDHILGPIASICAVARRLGRLADHDAVEMSRVILADAGLLVQELKRRGILSDVADDPLACSDDGGRPPHVA
ncbi:MAG: hypothetical protein GX446_11575 [Chthonomonadales bacterium]|nr:hypothetical protein [Chthonomonadales bacterium]